MRSETLTYEPHCIGDKHWTAAPQNISLAVKVALNKNKKIRLAEMGVTDVIYDQTITYETFF